VAAVFAALDEHFGRLDLLVNNAGVLSPPAQVAGMDPERAGRTFAVNALAPLLCAREAIRRMSLSHGGRGGAIINISSRAAVRGAAGEFVDYAMSKAVRWLASDAAGYITGVTLDVSGGR
jgi:NAD(P)-dependent dehydrogenase (short-subunit alcohol dehydrogenase family)